MSREVLAAVFLDCFASALYQPFSVPAIGFAGGIRAGRNPQKRGLAQRRVALQSFLRASLEGSLPALLRAFCVRGVCVFSPARTRSIFK